MIAYCPQHNQPQNNSPYYGNGWKSKKHHQTFPSDDACALQQMASGMANLDIWYSQQFVEKECNKDMLAHKEYIIFEHTPVIKGTIVGYIHVDDNLLCTFIINELGVFEGYPLLSDDFETYFDAKSCSMNLTTGEMTLKKNDIWAVDVKKKDYDVYMSYEYNMEIQQSGSELSHIKHLLETMKNNNIIHDYSLDKWGKVGIQKDETAEFLFLNVYGWPCDDEHSLMQLANGNVSLDLY